MNDIIDIMEEMCDVLEAYAFPKATIEQANKKYKDYNYKDFKIEVADSVCKFIKNVQDKFYEWQDNNYDALQLELELKLEVNDSNDHKLQ